MSLVLADEVLCLYKKHGCSIEYDGVSSEDFKPYLERPFYEIVGDMNSKGFERATTFDFKFDLVHERRGRQDVLSIRRHHTSD